MKHTEDIKTFGQLKKSGYRPRSIKEEMRQNLITKLKNKETVFPGVLGFDETVIPDLQRAILSRHNILLLGLRGQAKTRIARLLTGLLDDKIPVIQGSRLNDDPFTPITKESRNILAEMGDATPIRWLSRDERYVEKLATPDVSVADLIGDIDPIKAATLKLDYSDQRVIHYGLVPRAHRGIFVINELPDLQARIQVSLFNILQEGDIQIRGFKLRLPLDIQFIFTANPEDYTNRGSIITPLKDRIESQILTHYPESVSTSKQITSQEAQLSDSQKNDIDVPEYAADLVELVTMVARNHDYVDEKSGVSARLSISAMENLMSTAERRLLLTDETKTRIRLSDFWGIIPAITGKVELVYEGEQKGAYEVALDFISKATELQFLDIFPNPKRYENSPDKDPYSILREYFGAGNECLIPMDASEEEYRKALNDVPGLQSIADAAGVNTTDLYYAMELILHGLSSMGVLTVDIAGNQMTFRDELADMLGDM